MDSRRGLDLGLKRQDVEFEGAALRFGCHDPVRKRNVSIVLSWAADRPTMTTTLRPLAEER